MKIEQVSIESIIPYEKNAKKHPKKQVEQIVASIREFGWGQPIVVDKNDVIIVGHGRYMAAKAMELDTVPVLKLDLTEEQAKAYRLADNKLNESDWDMQAVIAELKDLSIPMIDLTGFSRDLAIEKEDKDDLVPAIPKTPKTKIGDIYQLGPHRLICGDSTKPEIYEKLMQGVKADMVFTDPPYNVNYAGRGKNTSEGIKNDNMSTEAFDTFLIETFKQIRANMKGGGRSLYFPFDLHPSTI